jgi:predicted protein tyrosine phosphatase
MSDGTSSLEYGSLYVCSLAAAQEADLSCFSAVITIEDPSTAAPFRIEGEQVAQLILRFDDISEPNDDFVLPDEGSVRSALEFGRRFANEKMMIHCHAGSRRSPAIALAILADRLGAGMEAQAVARMFEIAEWSSPNMEVIRLADSVLERRGALVSALVKAKGVGSALA